jgi:pantoate--beta-alanine ligase
MRTSTLAAMMRRDESADRAKAHEGPMIVARSNAELSKAIDVLGPTAFVPTMGALHAGHASLVTQAAALARARGFGGASVSIFVNPTQFNDPGDFARYPKTLDADLALCERAGARLVYVPSVEDVYPPGVVLMTQALPAVATRPLLEDAHRPGHFSGVVQVVDRLFELVRPAAALFGEKDWQQLAVIRAMEAGMELPSGRVPVEIVACPTLREADGLAMSSRNVFLSAADRARGLALSRALARASREPMPASAEAAMRDELAREGIEPEYAVVRDARTLLALPEGLPGYAAGRALIAARVGSVRLIDNASWPGAS